MCGGVRWLLYILMSQTLVSLNICSQHVSGTWCCLLLQHQHPIPVPLGCFTSRNDIICGKRIPSSSSSVHVVTLIPSTKTPQNAEQGAMSNLHVQLTQKPLTAAFLKPQLILLTCSCRCKEVDTSRTEMLVGRSCLHRQAHKCSSSTQTCAHTHPTQHSPAVLLMFCWER